MSSILPESVMRDIEKASKDYCVNDGFARDECGYDRDRRHFQIGAQFGYKLAQSRAAGLLKALEEIYIYRPKQAFSKFDDLGGLIHHIMDIANKSLEDYKK